MKFTEKQRVVAHNRRAKRLNAPATLTQDEWQEAISAFNGMCAYCQVEPFTILEHFLPIEVAGTTANNCVPACRSCNIRKGNLRGDELAAKFGPQILTRVKVYLYTSNKPDLPPFNGATNPRIRRKRTIDKFPPLKTSYFAFSKAHAEKLRKEGKEVEGYQ